jgi:hypothetical protein
MRIGTRTVPAAQDVHRVELAAERVALAGLAHPLPRHGLDGAVPVGAEMGYYIRARYIIEFSTVRLAAIGELLSLSKNK